MEITSKRVSFRIDSFWSPYEEPIQNLVINPEIESFQYDRLSSQ